MDASSLLETLRQAVPGAELEASASIDMPVVYVDRDHLVEVCRVLRDDAALQFAFLSDVTAVDYLPVEPRYELVYHLACLGQAYSVAPGGAAPARRLRLKVRVPGDHPEAPTVTTVFPTAGWCEREVFDLFGIVFNGHPDLRRILMTDDWEGHPLRKDYPVQIRKQTPSWSPLQVTAQEFAEHVRSRNEKAIGQSEAGPFDKLRAARRARDERES
jgi:NADH-quinone oxidoreductase subunit C